MDDWSYDEGIGEGATADGSPLPLLPPNRQFGERFLILSLLGRGGMGVVYRARDLISGREVALKILTRQLSPSARERLRREGQVTAALSHPGIVRIHSAGEVDGSPYLAYELVEGCQPLGEVLKASSRRERVELLRDTARALGEAHAHGIVHRDVKPENILVDSAGRPRVVDFGLAWSEELDQLTHSGALVGTPLFMSPEQLTSDRELIGPPTDVWALGVLLFLALTDEHPFDVDSLLELRARVCEGLRTFPRQLDPTVPVDLEAVCLKALETTPSLRYVDANAFADDLENALASRPVSASRSGWRRARSIVRSRGLLVGAVCLVCAGVVLVMALGTVGARREAALGELLARAEQAPTDELLAACDESGSPLSAGLHLALARRDGLGWEARIAHAERALRLDPSVGAQAHAARGHGLLAGGRLEEACEAFAAARRAGAPAPILLELGRAQVGLGQFDAAAEVLEEVLVEHPADYAASLLLMQAYGLAGKVQRQEELARTQAERLAAPQAIALRALARAATGGDPLVELENAARRFPHSPELALGVVQHLYLDRWEAQAALLALRRWPEPAASDPQVSRLARLLEELTASPPRLEALQRASLEERRAAIQWLLRAGERELAFWRRLQAAWMVTAPEALGVQERRRRALQCFQAAASLLSPKAGGLLGRARIGIAELEGATPAGRAALSAAKQSLGADPRVLRAEARLFLGAGEPGKAWERLEQVDPEARDASCWRACGEALLRLSRFPEARSALRQSLLLQPLDPEACQLLAQALEAKGEREEAKEFRVRASRLRREARADAQKAMDALGTATQRRARDSAVLVRSYRAVLELDPLWSEARCHLGKTLYVQGKRGEGLGELSDVLHRDPYFLLKTFRWLSKDLATFQALAGKDALANVFKGLELNDTLNDQRLRALSYAFLVELEGRGAEVAAPGVEDFDAVIAQEPADVVCYVLRALLHIRLRHFDQAARDLSIAEEAAPDCRPIYFYRALLAAAKGEPVEGIVALLEKAWPEEYDEYVDEGWDPAIHPELKELLGLPELKPFRRAGR